METKSVIFYILGTIALFPCVLVVSDSIVGGAVALVWGCIVWHSPKFCPALRRFWRNFWKVNYKLMDFL